MSKLTLFDNLDTIITKMSEGNPGCMMFLLEAFSKDKFAFCEIVVKLDMAELYGSHIYMLWNDCCDRDTQKTIRMILNLDRDTLRSYVVDKGYGTKYIESEEENG